MQRSTYTARIECPSPEAVARVVAGLGERDWTVKRYVTESIVAVSLSSRDAVCRAGTDLRQMLDGKEVLRWVMWIEHDGSC